jgi:hypothetical protein
VLHAHVGVLQQRLQDGNEELLVSDDDFLASARTSSATAWQPPEPAVAHERMAPSRAHADDADWTASQVAPVTTNHDCLARRCDADVWAKNAELELKTYISLAGFFDACACAPSTVPVLWTQP